MTFKMKRSQVYIRPNKNIPFHTELDSSWIDKVKNTTKEFSDNCEVDIEYIDDNYLRVNFWLPEYEDYVRMTDCLYDKGQLKEVFKDAMRYSKPAGIAFAMPSWWLNKKTESGIYIKEWYVNKKTRPDSKFLEEDKNTLKHRLDALKMYMKLDDCVMNCALYDYTHSIKHSYFLFTKRDSETENQINSIRQSASMNYLYKKEYNREQEIEYMIRSVKTSTLEIHDFHDVPSGYFTSEFQSLQIPIL